MWHAECEPSARPDVHASEKTLLHHRHCSPLCICSPPPALVAASPPQSDLKSAERKMRRAVVCICLPHASHRLEMECMARAVLLGCIPVTFFHHYLHPWTHTFPFK